MSDILLSDPNFLLSVHDLPGAVQRAPLTHQAGENGNTHCWHGRGDMSTSPSVALTHTTVAGEVAGPRKVGLGLR